MQKLRVILIHGNGGGKGTDNWFPYIKTELEKLGLEVLNPDFPDSVIAHENVWLPYLRSELKADQNTILIGHSSGAVAAMRYAEHNKLFGSVLVSPCYTDLGDETEKESGYYDSEWQWQWIKEHQNFIIQFASTDDPYISIEEARHIHEMLNTQYHKFTDQEHFLDKTEFPELIEALKAKLLL